jgi:cytochrome P450
MAIDLSRLSPEGFLRILQGETHRKYRRIFAEAFHAAELPPWLQARVLDRFRPVEAGSAGRYLSSKELREGAREIAADCMLRALFGVEPGSHRSHALKASYAAFGHDPPVRRIRRSQEVAFAALDDLRRAATISRVDAFGCAREANNAGHLFGWLPNVRRCRPTRPARMCATAPPSRTSCRHSESSLLHHTC